MLLFKSAQQLSRHLRSRQTNGRQIGFVPTMGALHEGHLSLVRQSLAENEWTVCSIFVNPTQFNDPDDLKKYPRTEGTDIAMLLDVQCDVLFLPGVPDIYPNGTGNGPSLSFGKLTERLEGAFRPGHFDGVAEVVHRLLEIVAPDHLYMGQKDYQQALIVQSMIDQLDLPVDMVLCPIVRHDDGLAMSSRNKRLGPDERREAAHINQVLQAAEKWKEAGFHPPEIRDRAFRHLEKATTLEPEYVDVIDSQTLEPLNHFSDDRQALICAAVWAGDVRLIDNRFL